MRFENEFFSLEDKTKDTVILLGPNGSGKSQSIFYMALGLDKKNIPYAKYSASREDSVRNSENFEGEDFTYSIVQAFKSEGERMAASFSLWFKNVGFPKMLDARKAGSSEFWLFIDELDSGLSYDRISMEVKELLSIQKLEADRGRKLHLVFTANSYEFLHALRKKTDPQVWSVDQERDLSEEIHSFEEFIMLYHEKYLYLKGL